MAQAAAAFNGNQMIIAALLEWAKSNPMLALAIVVIVGLGGTCSALYIDTHRLKSKMVDFQKENAALKVQISTYIAMTEGAADQIKLAQEQCRRLMEYEENKPKPRPYSGDDDDIDALVQRLLDDPTRGPVNAPGKDTSPAAPEN
jgi:hypothetical protein